MPCMRHLLPILALACASCTEDHGPGHGAQSAAVSSPPAAASASASAPAPSAERQALPADAVTIEQLQGRWRVKSSSGGPDHGQVFYAMIRQIVRIEGDKMIIDDHGARFTKAITLFPGTSPQAIDLRQTDDAKSWSRVGIVEVRGKVLLLAVTFPQNLRPESMTPIDDGREVVVLERAP